MNTTSSASGPSPAATLLANVIVGAAVTAVIGRQAGAAPALAGAVLAVAVHHALDAPLARQLSARGI